MFGLKELDALQLHGLLQEQDGKSLVLLDVRTPAEVAGGGIRGARNVPLHLLPVVGQGWIMTPRWFCIATPARVPLKVVRS